jgi:hypothetical protein
MASVVMASMTLWGCTSVGYVDMQSAEAKQALQQFTDAYPDWRAEVHYGVRLSGPGIAMTGTTAWNDRQLPERVAEGAAGLLRAQRILLGADGLEPHYVCGSRAGDVMFLRFEWLAGNGVRVSSRADLAVRRDGKVVLLSSRAPRLDRFDWKPALTPGEARVRVARYLQQDAQVAFFTHRAEELFVAWEVDHPDRAAPRLVYEVFLDPQRVPGRFFVDANSGAVTVVRGIHGAMSAVPPARLSLAPAQSAPRAPTRVGLVPTILQVSAPARQGLRGDDMPTPTPMVGVQVYTNGQLTGVTGGDGRLPVNVAAGDQLSTLLCGVPVPGQGPSTPWLQTVPGPVPPVLPWALPPDAVDRATLNYWNARAGRRVRELLGALPQADVIEHLWVQFDAGYDCYCGYADAARWLLFAPYDASGSCPSFAFSTLILHEIGHGFDEASAGFHDQPLDEACADIFAMVVSDQSKIGEFHAGDVMRDCDNGLHVGHSSLSAGAHYGEPLNGFAWRVYDGLRTLRSADAAGAVLLGVIAGDPDTQVEFVQRVLATVQNFVVPDPAAEQLVRTAAAEHGFVL